MGECSDHIKAVQCQGLKTSNLSKPRFFEAKPHMNQKTLKLQPLLQLAAMLESLEAQMALRDATTNPSTARGPPYRLLADREGGLWPRQAKERLRKFPGAIYPRGASISVRAHHRFYPLSLAFTRREWRMAFSFPGLCGLHTCFD
jgi:hypothetical protein